MTRNTVALVALVLAGCGGGDFHTASSRDSDALPEPDAGHVLHSGSAGGHSRYTDSGAVGVAPDAEAAAGSQPAPGDAGDADGGEPAPITTGAGGALGAGGAPASGGRPAAGGSSSSGGMPAAAGGAATGGAPASCDATACPSCGILFDPPCCLPTGACGCQVRPFTCG